MKERLGEFELTLHDVREDSKESYLGRAQWFGEWLVREGIKSFDKAEKKHIDAFLSGYSNVNTKNLFTQVFRRFYQDLKPEVVTHLKIQDVEIPEITPSETLTPDEVMKLACEAGKKREEMKYLILALYESCARISEFLALRLGDVRFTSVNDKEGKRKLIATLHFKRSKGGVRKQPVTLVMFAVDLQRWVTNHPCKGDEQAWLFPSPRNLREPLSESNVGDVLWYAGQRLGIKKRLNCHWLRHSSLSWFANCRNYSNVMLGIRAGWTPGSPMAKRYVHTGSEIERRVYLEKMGLIESEEPEKKILPKTCPHCQALNPYTNDVCDLCAMPLDPQKYKEEIEKRRNIEQLYINVQQISEKKLTLEQQRFLEKRTDTILGLLELGREDLAREYMEKLLEHWTKLFLMSN
jgi:site-specific recombinase XerD